MNKICYKVLSISEAYLFKQNKNFYLNYNIYDGKIGSENNIHECKNKIKNFYKNQSVTIFLLNKNKKKNLESCSILNYDDVVGTYDVIFDENNILEYFDNIDNLDKKFCK
jgi:hypothetical protein